MALVLLPLVAPLIPLAAPLAAAPLAAAAPVAGEVVKDVAVAAPEMIKIAEIASSQLDNPMVLKVAKHFVEQYRHVDKVGGTTHHAFKTLEHASTATKSIQNSDQLQQNYACFCNVRHFLRKAKQFAYNLPQAEVANSSTHGGKMDEANETNKHGHERLVYLQRWPLSSLAPNPNSRWAWLHTFWAEQPPVSHWALVVRTHKTQIPGITWEVLAPDNKSWMYHMKELGINIHVELPNIPTPPPVNISPHLGGGRGHGPAQNPGHDPTQNPGRGPDHPLGQHPDTHHPNHPGQGLGQKMPPGIRKMWDSNVHCKNCCKGVPFCCPCFLLHDPEPYVVLPHERYLGKTNMTDMQINEAARAIKAKLGAKPPSPLERLAILLLRIYLVLFGIRSTSSWKKTATQETASGNYNLLWRNCQVFAMNMAFATAGKSSGWRWYWLKLYFFFRPSSANLLGFQNIFTDLEVQAPEGAGLDDVKDDIGNKGDDLEKQSLRSAGSFGKGKIHVAGKETWKRAWGGIWRKWW